MYLYAGQKGVSCSEKYGKRTSKRSALCLTVFTVRTLREAMKKIATVWGFPLPKA